MYFLMFAGAIRLAWQEKKQFHWLIILFSIIGFIGIAISLCVSFTPPASLRYGSQLHYVLFLTLCLLLITSMSIWGKKLLCHGLQEPGDTTLMHPELLKDE